MNAATATAASCVPKRGRQCKLVELFGGNGSYFNATEKRTGIDENVIKDDGHQRSWKRRILKPNSAKESDRGIKKDFRIPGVSHDIE